MSTSARNTALITDGQARTIAMNWHGGQWTHLYSLGSSGHIDHDGVTAEISAIVQQLPVGQEHRPLLALDKYVRHTGDRAPVTGWPQLWDERSLTLDQC